MEINRENIFTICDKNNIKPDKDYGQNFLVEPRVSSHIVDLLYLENDERVLEIGPGLGSLSHFLSLHSNDIDLLDIDFNMVGFLEKVYSQNENINVILGDIRNHDVSSYDKIIGNLPYNLTTEIITYLLMNAVNVKRMVLMCQTEAYYHFYNTSGSEYGPVSVLLHLIANINKAFLVSKGNFYPVPKVESIVFMIDFTNEVEREKAMKVYAFAKQLFLNRRKTILNNLTRYLKDKEMALNLLKYVDIAENLRPEQLSPNQYLALYDGLMLFKKTNSSILKEE